MLLVRTAAPADLLSAAELKAHLRIDHSYDDTTIDAIRAAVTEHLDGRHGYLKRAIMSQTWTIETPLFPAGTMFHFPFPPLRSITSVQYYDVDNALQTLSSSDYYVYSQAHVGYLKLKATATWPSTFERDDAVKITFVCGYADSASVPTAVRQAALLIAGQLYANRGDASVEGAERAMPDAARRLLTPYRLTEFMASNEQYWEQTRAGTLR